MAHLTIVDEGYLGHEHHKNNKHQLLLFGFKIGLVTEFFPAGSDYIDNDTLFGVRVGLIVHFKPCQNSELAKRYKLQAPFNEVQFEFCLVKDTQ